MDKIDDKSKQIQKSHQYSIERLKNNTGLIQRGLKDLGIVSDDLTIDQYLAEFFAELDEMKDGDRNSQEDELRAWWSDPTVKYLIEKALNGEDCDEIHDGLGDFGLTPTNPIPVNGVVGEYKYLNRLRFNGERLIYHRIDIVVELGSEVVDAYDVVTMDGKHWNTLFFDFYHPRRSKTVPAGYTYSPDTGSVKELILNACTIGTDSLVETFPFEMEEFILNANRNLLGKVARNLYKEAIKDKGKFFRPESI